MADDGHVSHQLVELSSVHHDLTLYTCTPGN